MIKRAVVFYIREEGSHFAKGEGGTLFVKKKTGNRENKEAKFESSSFAGKEG